MEGNNVTKTELALLLSEEILNNIEENESSLEQILLKCKKLARLRDDFDAMEWFSSEIKGYDDSNFLKKSDLEKYAFKSGRTIKKIEDGKEVLKYYTPSIIELESEIQSQEICLENLKPPSNFTPSINKSTFPKNMFGPTSSEVVVEKYSDVLKIITTREKSITQSIKEKRAIISKLKNGVHEYVFNINIQLRFENSTESLFQEMKENTDKKLAAICPNSLKKLIAAYNRLDSTNPEEWSQAMSSCRNVIKDFADYVFPAQKEKYIKKNTEILDVTDDKYKNRLLAFIDKNSSGDKNKLLSSRASDLVVRIHSLNDLLSKGTHVELDIQDFRICLLDTYLLIASLLPVIGDQNEF